MKEKSFISLAKKDPELAAQWHPEKNGDLTPEMVSASYGKKVWWLFPYDDPITGKHFDFEWEATVKSRVRAKGCPFLSGQRVWPGFNDLATRNPKVANEWHPTKNGDKIPQMYAEKSSESVWWLFPYDDPITGKHFDFEWEATISSRSRGAGCPFLTGKAVWPGFNDLATRNPGLAAQWHPLRNGDLTPQEITEWSSEKVWWLLPYDDPFTGKHFDFEWEAAVKDRSGGRNCPFLSGRAVWPGFNDLVTRNPELAAQWHPTKNGELTPFMVTASSDTTVWWSLPYDDPFTGKHFDFEWEARIASRNAGNGCPFLSGAEVWLGFNDLVTRNPRLAAQWHPTKNGDLSPEMVTASSMKSVWWLLPYDDPITGKHFDFEWEATINTRANGAGCPFLTNRLVWTGFNDLATRNPELAAQWHPTKNGDLTPETVRYNSTDSAWWLLPYDDPITGKHFDFEWEAKIYNRLNGSGCPFLSGSKVWPGFNDLATRNPKLAAQLHPTKNGEITAELITAGSNKPVWWLLPYDDPFTGKHFEFEWQATVCARNSGVGCPFLAGASVWPGFNDLLTKNPALAAQWHPTKNGDLTPQMVTENSGLSVWWLLPYDDPFTGKHFDFEWEAVIEGRSSGNGCPYLTGRAVWPGFNDLLTRNPALAAQWHPTKNGILTPEMFTAWSGESVWWLFKYDDPETNKHYDFEWEATIASRNAGRGCPFISNRATYIGFNDLVSSDPVLAAQWHPTKNGDLTPEMFTRGSAQKVWWYLPYDDPFTGKHFDFEWEAVIADRSAGIGCPFLSNRAVWLGYNDLVTVDPELASQWHPTKNGDLTPEMFTRGSSQKVWWYLPYDDPFTGKHFNFEWEATVAARSVGNGCPYLTGRAVWLGYNDLATVDPELATQWHPTKNGDLSPEMVTVSSMKSVWWFLPYDDPITGKHFDFEWEATVAARSVGNGCPYLTGRAVWLGYNDLATVDPELAAQWHPTKNGDLTPEMFTHSSSQKVWWYLPYDDPKTGKHFDFEWEAVIADRSAGIGCPFLSNRAVWPGYNDLATVDPELAGQWHLTKNGDITPEMVTYRSSEKAWWLYPYDDPFTGKHFDFEWEAVISDRSEGVGCPFLSNRAVWPGYNDLATVDPELAAQWHPTKNGDLTPEMVTYRSSEKVWWYLPYDDPKTGKHFDFEWEAVISDRSEGNGCPYLSNRAVWPGYNDLGTVNPDLAIRWHPKKNRIKKPTQFTANSATKVWWQCLVCGHEWRASIVSRNHGAGCRICGNW